MIKRNSKFIFWKNVHQIALQDFKRRYMGTIMGTLWAILSPVIRFSAYAFAVAVGFRNSDDVNGHNFLPWLITALAAWFLTSEALPSGSKSLIRNRTLIESMPYDNRVYIFSTNLSIVYSNILFYAVVIFVYIPFYGYGISFDIFAFIYYYISLVTFLIGLSFITSVLTVYIRDVSNMIAASTTLMFWLTPILYPVTKFEKHNCMWIANINPFHYCINGARNALLHDFDISNIINFNSVIFWGYVLIIWIVGLTLYHRTKKQIVDVI
jgi:ABC-type polysaccharide/polyol phosphate export permease